MDRHFVGNTKGLVDMHTSVALKDAGVMIIEGILVAEGYALPEGLHLSGVMHLKLPEGPTSSASNSVACSGGTACLDHRMTICV